jgi:asparagine synthase (glutamine-hydrolysing)
MCGIAGILALDPRKRVDEARLKRMRDVLHHRGPDGRGLLVDGPVGLGHRRLSIIDVAGGAQPMANEDETVWIVFNGEIYNHRELRPGLEALGHRYRTHSDTETILHLYEEEGEACVERLQGMFAFAIWDRRLGRLLLARDRLGIKPLYLARTDEELLFGSEVKALLEAGFKPSLNEEAIPEFLATGFVSGEDTFFRGIRQLRPGHTLTWSQGDGPSERRYWRLPPVEDVPRKTFLERAHEVGERLEASVKSHLMSDVPLGVFLSGGLDSSGILSLAARHVKGRVRTFAVGFEEQDFSELAYARLSARSVGALHREVVVSPADFFGALPRLVWHEDAPIAFPSSVPLYFVARLAAEDVKVVLTGEGADELFLGYNRYRVTAWNQRLGRAYWAVVPRRVRGALTGLVGGLPREVRRYAQRSFLSLEPGARTLFYENFAVFPKALRTRVVSDALRFQQDPYAHGLRCYDEAPGGPLEQMSHADLQTYLVRLLMKQDQMSMAASVESRVPYLDHTFVEFVASLHGRYKLRGFETKAVLRAALKGSVPPEILTRKKMGFPVPLSRWFRGPFSGVVEEFVLGPRALARGLFDGNEVSQLAAEHRSGFADHGARLWLLANLEIWQRVFVDGEDASFVMRAA